MFAKKTYVDRRRQFIAASESGVYLFLGNSDSPMNYADNPYPFRQDSTFLYYFGLNYADLAAVIDVDSGEVTLFGDELTIDMIVWTGPQPTLKEKSAAVGVERVQPMRHLSDMLDAIGIEKRPVHLLPPYRSEHYLKYLQLFSLKPEQVDQHVSVSFVRTVVNQRIYKSEEEIAEIERACDVTADMHLAVYRTAGPGMTEADMATLMHHIALSANCTLSFPIIATINGQTLHNHYHGNTLKNGDMLLIDAGAETEMGYAGDMSSTLPVDSTFTSRQKEIYEVAVSAHFAAVSALAPGVHFKEVHFAACRILAEGLKAIGLMRGDTDEIVSGGAHALFMPHGVGHLMGLDVHDMENFGEKIVGYDGRPKSAQFGLKSLRLSRTLEPGFVHTIEPGIYFIPELIAMWKAGHRFADFINYDRVETYKDFGGIRNEENFVITESGARMLGKAIPKTIGEVESIRP